MLSCQLTFVPYFLLPAFEVVAPNGAAKKALGLSVSAVIAGRGWSGAATGFVVEPPPGAGEEIGVGHGAVCPCSSNAPLS